MSNVILGHFHRFGFVYAIRAANHLIKIGWARNPYDRMDAMLTGSAVRLELLGFVPATLGQEADLLKLLSQWHSHREWFRPEGAVIDFLRQLPPRRPICLSGRIYQGGDNGFTSRKCQSYSSHNTCDCMTPEMPQFMEPVQ